MSDKELLPLLPERLVTLKTFGHNRYEMKHASHYAKQLDDAGINYETDVNEYHQHSDFVFLTDTPNYKKAKKLGLTRY